MSQTSQQAMRIAVLYGGDSSERNVSLESGETVASALEQRGHRVTRIDVRGRKIDNVDPAAFDLAFIVLHGEFGEDGQIQRLLEAKGIPYTGSGVEASRIAMDKVEAKEHFVAHGIPTPEYGLVTADTPDDEWRRVVTRVGFPQIIKPAREGSTVGVALAQSMDEALAGIEQGFKFDSRVLVEQFIRGRELTVGILGRQALPIIELIYPGPIFDIGAKYTPGVTRHVINPEMPAAVDAEIKRIALAAHDVLGCRDLSRVDVMLTSDFRPFVLEVNTIPGMTKTSLLPDAARAAGIGLQDLCERIACSALTERHGVRQDA